MSGRAADIGARMWLLMLLDAAERYAIAPIPVARLHRLVYLANAMAPVYDLPTPDGYILKNLRGPFFPAVQWDVDRMAAQGLVTLANTGRVEDQHGWRLVADYGLSKKGMEVVDFACTLEEVAEKAAFLREVVRAFTAMDLDASDRDASLLEDVGYAVADDQAPVDFRTAANNLTMLAADRIASRGGDGEEGRGRRAEVHLYLKYLERVWVKRSEAARVA